MRCKALRLGFPLVVLGILTLPSDFVRAKGPFPRARGAAELCERHGGRKASRLDGMGQGHGEHAYSGRV